MSMSVRASRLSVLALIVGSAVTLHPVHSFAWDDGAEKDATADRASEATDPVQRATEYLNTNNTNLVTNALLSNDGVWLFTDRDSSIGVDVTPLNAALRSQLGLTDDRGVVVSNVESDGPGAQAGIQFHDVVLSAGGKPVNSAASLEECVHAAGEEAIPIILMRGGKRMSVEVTPSSLNVLGVDFDRNYWIGITAAAADDALRTQLALPENQGLVVTEVYDESAAASAGIEVHDVLLEFADAPLSSIEELNNRIQEVGGEPATIKLIRGGDVLTLKVTPRAREGGDGMLWVYDTSRSVRNLAEITAQYAGAAYNPNLNQNWLFPQTNGLYVAGSGGVNLFNPAVTVADAYNQAALSVYGGTTPAQLDTRTVAQQLQGLVEETRALTERLRALEEAIRNSSEAGEAPETQPESDERDDDGESE